MEAMFREHHGWLHGRLRRRLANASDADDVAAETFLRVAEDGGRSDIREPRAFLTTLAKRVLFGLWRRRDLEQAYLDTLRHMPQALALSPEEHALMLDAIQHIDRALGSLPAPVKAAFLLSRLDGLAYPDIARQLGVSLATVERHMQRALLHCLRYAP